MIDIARNPIIAAIAAHEHPIRSAEIDPAIIYGYGIDGIATRGYPLRAPATTLVGADIQGIRRAGIHHVVEDLQRIEILCRQYGDACPLRMQDRGRKETGCKEQEF